MNPGGFAIFVFMTNVTLGVVRETKSPPDRRVPLSPVQCRQLMDKYEGLRILVQPSERRCFKDEEYREEGVPLSEELSSCDILLGVKEVKIDSLLAGKTYLFFSHTAKKQPYNRALLQAVIARKIRLLDYEYLTDRDQVRVVAFGRWAGVVGAYNGLRGWGLRSGKFRLPPAHTLKDLEEMRGLLREPDMEKTRIVLTGGGRVAGGALEILRAAGIREVEPEAFLSQEYGEAVFTRLDPWHYTRHRAGKPFDFQHFITFPGEYESTFKPYALVSHLFVAAHFWDPASPRMLSREDLKDPALPLSLIADISCDIDGPIASTIRASTIEEPFYGYAPESGEETPPFTGEALTVMAVDNLPGELPRDASLDFGEALVERVIPELLGVEDTGMLERAAIAEGGSLTSSYAYLQDYLEGRE
jgi:alanine dehydrogenase